MQTTKMQTTKTTNYQLILGGGKLPNAKYQKKANYQLISGGGGGKLPNANYQK